MAIGRSGGRWFDRTQALAAQVVVGFGVDEAVKSAKLYLEMPHTEGAWCQRCLDLARLLINEEFDEALRLAAEHYRGNQTAAPGSIVTSEGVVPAGADHVAGATGDADTSDPGSASAAATGTDAEKDRGYISESIAPMTDCCTFLNHITMCSTYQLYRRFTSLLEWLRQHDHA